MLKNICFKQAYISTQKYCELEQINAGDSVKYMQTSKKANREAATDAWAKQMRNNNGSMNIYLNQIRVYS